MKCLTNLRLFKVKRAQVDNIISVNIKSWSSPRHTGHDSSPDIHLTIVKHMLQGENTERSCRQMRIFNLWPTQSLVLF